MILFFGNLARNGWSEIGVVIMETVNPLELRYEEAGRLLSALDEMGFGEWTRRWTGGGCYLLECVLADGRHVWVTGDDVLSSVCDPADFGTSVLVGLYASEEAIIDGDESLALVGVPLAVEDRTAVGIAVAVHGVMSAWEGVE